MTIPDNNKPGDSKPDDSTPDTTGSGDNKPGREGPTKARITMWIVVGAVALYFIGNGLYGILTK